LKVWFSLIIILTTLSRSCRANYLSCPTVPPPLQWVLSLSAADRTRVSIHLFGQRWHVLSVLARHVLRLMSEKLLVATNQSGRNSFGKQTEIIQAPQLREQWRCLPSFYKGGVARTNPYRPRKYIPTYTQTHKRRSLWFSPRGHYSFMHCQRRVNKNFPAH